MGQQAEKRSDRGENWEHRALRCCRRGVRRTFQGEVQQRQLRRLSPDVSILLDGFETTPTYTDTMAHSQSSTTRDCNRIDGRTLRGWG